MLLPPARVRSFPVCGAIFDFLKRRLATSPGFAFVGGSPAPNPGVGLDREIKVAEVGALPFIQELYRTLVTFLQAALNVDLTLADSRWLYEQVVADHFRASGRWPTLGELYQRA